MSSKSQWLCKEGICRINNPENKGKSEGAEEGQPQHRYSSKNVFMEEWWEEKKSDTRYVWVLNMYKSVLWTDETKIDLYWPWHEISTLLITKNITTVKHVVIASCDGDDFY